MFGNSKDGKNINKNTLATQHETELERRKNIVADAMFEATGLKCNAAITNPNENYCYKYHWTGGMDYIMDSDNEMVCTNIVYELLNSDTQIFMSRPEKKSRGKLYRNGQIKWQARLSENVRTIIGKNVN